MDADQFADPPGRGRTRVRSGLDRADIAAHHDADQPGADKLLAGQHHVGGFDHGVGSFDCSHQTLCLNQAKGIAHLSSNSREIITVAHLTERRFWRGRGIAVPQWFHSDLMIVSHRSLTSGKGADTAEALRQTSLTTLRSPRRLHPFY